MLESRTEFNPREGGGQQKNAESQVYHLIRGFGWLHQLVDNFRRSPEGLPTMATAAAAVAPHRTKRTAGRVHGRPTPPAQHSTHKQNRNLACAPTLNKIP